MQLTPSISAVYGLLFLSVFCLWLPGQTRVEGDRKRPWWPYPFLLAVLCGLVAGFVHVVAIPIMLALSAAVLGFTGKWGKWGQWLGGAAMVILGLGLMAHLLPGFSNQKYIDGLKLTSGSTPYSSYLNFDKTMMGLFFLALTHQRVSRVADWKHIGVKLPLNLLIVLLIIMPVSLALGYVRFEPKLVSILPVWILVNLASTCMAEEMFFRGFVQKTLMTAWGKTRLGAFLALLTASLAFGLLHYRGGPYYVLLSTLAGMGYGYAYHRTGKIESAILTHFLLNFLHILLFTYPAAAT